MLQIGAGIISNSSEDILAFSIWTLIDSALPFLSRSLGYLQNNLSLLIDLGYYIWPQRSLFWPPHLSPLLHFFILPITTWHFIIHACLFFNCLYLFECLQGRLHLLMDPQHKNGAWNTALSKYSWMFAEVYRKFKTTSMSITSSVTSIL